jgi:acyl-coenzyme A synthetase/AMP-(fatty) acid ligase
MFLEYIDKSLFDYAGEMMFVFGKQSHMLARNKASIVAAEKLTNSTKVRWINGQHGQFFYPGYVVELAREVLAFLDGTYFKVPQRVLFFNEMPRDPVGKINRLSVATQAQGLTKQDDEHD